MLVLDHILISDGPGDGNVCGGVFETAKPDSADEAERVATLTLMTPGGAITVSDEAALVLWQHYQNSARRIEPTLPSVNLSESAFKTLQDCIAHMAKPEIIDTLTYISRNKINAALAIIQTVARRPSHQK